MFFPYFHMLINFTVSFASLKSLLKKLRMYVCLRTYLCSIRFIYWNSIILPFIQFSQRFFFYSSHSLFSCTTFDLRRETFFSYLFFLHYYVSKLCRGTIDENVYFLSIYPKALLLAGFEEWIAFILTLALQSRWWFCEVLLVQFILNISIFKQKV